MPRLVATSRSRSVSIKIAAVALVALAACGCGQAPTRIEGVVTLDGEPLPNAMVQFFPLGSEGRTAAVQTDATGRFLVNVSPHPMRVAISARKVVGQVKDGEGMADLLEDMVPDRFRSPTASELSVTPAAGTVTKAEFTLTSANR